ncbi:hypothetical protein HU200_037316 [Digitaria exilis]|uniref:Uncharacterized protein n=1 Tax=Digitaria exilis TaxID=1010633 RepID=A0A835BRR1_9POAL|nr:hypothetical protein HU200_037316 [Digitaria exilis]
MEFMAGKEQKDVCRPVRDASLGGCDDQG